MVKLSGESQFQATILIVDDTPNNLQVLFKFLKDANYKILVAQDGSKALQISQSAHPDLILLDIMMSGINGFETCRQLKSHPDTQDIPIIFMTAVAETKSKLKGFKLGAVDYITKPINRQELLARIQTHLTLKNLNLQLAEAATRKQLLLEITNCIRQSFNLDTIFQTATQEILKVFKCDRTALVRLSNQDIVIEAQSVANDRIGNFPQRLSKQNLGLKKNKCQDFNNLKLETPAVFCRQDYLIEQDWDLEPIFNLHSESKTIQARLSAPILLRKKTFKANQMYSLWGWLIVEQCQPRQWQPEEMELCNNLSDQLAIAIEQGLLHQQLRHQNRQLDKSNKQLKWANQQLQQLALLDPLTQVFNRRYFDEQLNREWRRHRRNVSSPLSLIMCDVDCFKLYNDTYGHQQGDECLQQVAHALAQVLKRPADILARYGGEEFVIILPNTHQAGAIQVAESMRLAVKDLKIPHLNSTVDSIVTISLGLASTIPNAENHPTLLIEQADRGLYLAKNRGRDCLAVTQQDIWQLKRTQNDELDWGQRIRQALKHNLFTLFAQPITSLDSDEQKQRFEILLRLTDRDPEAISPNAFFEIAARNSLMIDIDTWVIDNLLQILANSNNQNWQNYRFSINLSGASLNSQSFRDKLSQKLLEHNLPPELFGFEITESIAISNIDSVSSFIQSLKALGCSFALDDFGKGMSSLSYLKNLPIDYLKIDGSFITELNQDKVSKIMVEAINHIAGGMGLKTVAEFVESQDILDTVRDLKVDYAQGYHLGRPRKLVDFLA